MGKPSVTTLDDTYLAAIAEAEIAWLGGVMEQLSGGGMAWSAELLAGSTGEAPDC